MEDDKPKIIAIIGSGVNHGHIRDMCETHGIETISVDDGELINRSDVYFEMGEDPAFQCEEECHLRVRYTTSSTGPTYYPNEFYRRPEQYKSWERNIPFPRPPKVAQCSAKHRGNPCRKKRRK